MTKAAGKYSSYLEYKKSGVEWLGPVPSDWRVVRLRFVCDVTTGDKDTVHSDDDGAYPFFVRSDHVERISTYSFDGEAVLTAGDGAIGKIFHYYNGKFDFHQRVYMFFNFRKIDGRFFYHYVSANLAHEVVKLSAKTTVDSLRLPMLLNFTFVFPDIYSQRAISAFIDHESAKIDTLIDKQQQLIKLLKEKRQAVISHAVTKGLNPDAVMKDSGVEWLSEVPEHWVVKRLGVLFSESSARANTEAELEYPILSVSIHHGISDKELDESELDRKVSRSEDKSLYKIVKDNDLAYNMMRAWQGGFGASKLNGLISPAYVVCKPETKINSSYYELVLRSPNAVTELKRFSRGITDFRLRLYWDEFKSICVPVPPETEIDQILGHVSRVNSKYDHLADVAQRQIDLLQERRTALISAAVTGKIDVRNWQPAQAETIREASA